MEINTSFILAVLVVIVALAFDFVNGFHDAANSIATIVATRVLTPFKAVLWAAFFNFSAVFVFNTGVAKMVGSGMISLNSVTPVVILAGLIGAIAWGLVTWWFKIPTSSSHALLGGYAGAAMTYSALHHGMRSFLDPIISSGWSQTILFIVLAPILGLALGHLLMRLTIVLFYKVRANKVDGVFRYCQLASSAFLSLMHGSNDAQKTAGIISGALFTAGYFQHFTVPIWVLWLSYGTMGLGTFFGGWRIVHTMGRRLTRLRPSSGFCAETAAALSILLATELLLPVSTTQTTTGAILGVGSIQRLKAVRWGVARNIAWAWIMTIPAAAVIGSLVMLVAVKIDPS